MPGDCLKNNKRIKSRRFLEGRFFQIRPRTQESVIKCIALGLEQKNNRKLFHFPWQKISLRVLLQHRFLTLRVFLTCNYLCSERRVQIFHQQPPPIFYGKFLGSERKNFTPVSHALPDIALRVIIIASTVVHF